MKNNISTLQKHKYNLKFLDCANCANKIEQALQSAKEVTFAKVDFATSTLHISGVDINQARHLIKQIEPGVDIRELEVKTNGKQEHGVRKELVQIIIAAILFIIGLVLRFEGQFFYNDILEFVAFGISYIISGRGVLLNASRNIIRGRIFDETFLMSIATLGAIVIGEMPEAVGVMLFYQIGEYLQQRSVNHSRRSIRALLELQPNKANLLIDGTPTLVHPADVKVADIILARPGERIPLDGNVINGISLVDTSPLTGEPVPRQVQPGDHVLSGMINISGAIKVKVTHIFKDSAVARILDLVESAGVRKAKTEKFITSFARIYSPIVVLLAIVVAIFPPLIFNTDFAEWIYRALVVLVIACPCALVISIPLGYFGGVGGASKRGILIKGSEFLDTLAQAKIVIFDKTGTLTKGSFKVIKIVPDNGYSESELLKLAVLAEAQSNHPIAQSIKDAYGHYEAKSNADYTEIIGYGVQTYVGGQELIAGSDHFLHLKEISHDQSKCNQTGTVVHVALDGTHVGHIVIADETKNDSLKAVQELKALGIQEVVMLTGDNPESASDIATTLGIDSYQAGLLPGEKVSAVEKILSDVEDGGKVVFVGDGINDAPALMRADVGIAMGALGSDAAIQTADVVIMTDKPSKVAEAIRVGRKTRRIVWQNILLALFIKVIFVTLGIVGEANMWQAVFADMGVALLALLNAARVIKA